jgi:hypothetical protein
MDVVRNFSFHGEPIEIELSGPYILLIGPLALDGLSADLQTMFEIPRGEIPERIRELSCGVLIGLAHVRDFCQGRYRLGNGDFEETDDEADSSVFDIDSGTVCVIDLDNLRSTAKALTWGRYDAFLQSQAGDNSIWIAIMKEVGGPFFGMLNGDVSTPFRGDGSYRLKPNAPHLMNP